MTFKLKESLEFKILEVFNPDSKMDICLLRLMAASNDISFAIESLQNLFDEEKKLIKKKMGLKFCHAKQSYFYKILCGHTGEAFVVLKDFFIWESVVLEIIFENKWLLEKYDFLKAVLESYTNAKALSKNLKLSHLNTLKIIR